MRVSLIKSDKISNLILPNKIKGNYWITDTDDQGNEKNLICIEANSNNKWQLVSNSEVYYVKNDAQIPSVELETYQFYIIKNSTSEKYQNMILYCSPVYDDTYKNYIIDEEKDKEIKIGSDQSCDIVYQSPNISSLHATIKYVDKKYILIATGITYLNDLLVKKETQLENGDIIFLMGLKIILIQKDNQTSLMINNPFGQVTIKYLPSLEEIPESAYEEAEEETDIKLYSDDDNFHKKPRFIRKVEELQINIDPPPSKQEEDDRPWILTVGPMVTMSMMSMMSVYNVINNMTMYDMPLSRSMPSLIMGLAMLCGTLLWPSINRRYEKKRQQKKEHERQEKYKKYIDDKKKLIQEDIIKQKNILMDNFPTTLECQNIILSKMTRLWERRLGDDDFLTLNLGIGNQDMLINIMYPEEHFTMVEDNLNDIARTLGEEPKQIQNVSIPLSLMENNILGIVGNKGQTASYMSQLFLQVMTFHSYDDLKIVMLTNKDMEHNWEFLKILPHTFNNDHSIRFFADNNDEYKEIFYLLDKEYTIRTTRENKNYLNYPHYLIVTDSFKSIRNFDFIKKILNNKENLGFSLIILTEKITNIPDQCKSFVNIYQEKAELYRNEINNKAIVFNLDLDSNYKYYECAKVLANIHIEIDSEEEGQLPNKLGFLQMYDVGKIEQLNSPNRWAKNNPILSLAAPIGFGKNGEKIVLDLHEKYHGPHGLIAGMTGSGKSEFLITYILSMAINFHPYEVQFILIDYKGGGLAGAFENANINLKLPHLVGTITNLDATEIKRSLASIDSELKRRQRLFNIAREKTGESTIDIYKYQKMYRNGIVKEPISHLFIISDEFAELKTQQPEFMSNLISTARIGRSLGVHLILATQKPSGVVDPQIWSNTRFRICLRVQEKSDSTEVIKRPDAALLKQTGRFYFQVGFDEIFVLGQAAWCGGQYIPSEKIRKELDTSINFIDNIGYIIKSTETRKKVELGPSLGEELINMVKYLSNIAKEENIKCKPLWLEKIPAVIFVNNLINKYDYKKEPFIINPVVGEFDIPNMQQQHLLTVPITKEGNALIYGVAGSGKENFITTLLYSSLISYNPVEVNYYIIDFGSEALNAFKNAPIIGDILHSDDDDKIENLYKMLTKMIEERKKLFSNYNGDYLTYCKKSGKSVPTVILIINNFEAYQETFSEYDEVLNVLSRDGSKYGINFIFTISTPNGIRFKLRQNFNQEFVLQQNNNEDYNSILGNVRKTFPSKIFGRGIIKREDVYEFQTAYVCEKDKIQEFVRDISIKYNTSLKEKALRVPVLPDIVSYNDIKDKLTKDKNIVVGIAKSNLEVIKYDIYKNNINIISSTDLNSTYKYLRPLINQMLYLNNSQITLINAEDFGLDFKYSKYMEYVNSAFDNYFEKLYNYILDCHGKYISNGYSRDIFKNVRQKTIIIVGFEAFKNKLNPNNAKKIGSIFEKSKDLGIINYIIVDSIDKIKKLELEIWFKTCANTSDGIWIGPGINDQFTMKITQRTSEIKEQIDDNFCFVLKRGKPILVKYVSSFDIRLM